MKKFPISFLRLAITSLFVLFTGIIFSQISPVTTPKGGFKIDGYLRANTPTASRAGDWLPQVNGTNFSAGVDSFVIKTNGDVKDNVTTQLQRDLYNSSLDDIFTQGSKFADAIGALHHGLGGAPNKNDIHNGVFHASGDNATPSNQWVFIGGDRLDVAGTSYIDFQFLQGTITTNASTFTGSGPCGGRTVNDINISMEYNNGGTAPKVVIYRWVPTNDAGTAGTWDSTGSSLITDAYAKTNLVTVDVPIGGFAGINGVDVNSYQPFAFVEAGINVTQLVTALGGNCAGLSIKTLWITTKASSSSTAALKDYMAPITLDLNFGGVTIDQKGPLCALAPNITLTGSPAGGTFSGPGVTGSIFSATDAGVGSHRIIYTASAGVNCEKKDTMWIVVNPNPTATVNSPTMCASDPAVNVTATPGSGIATDYNYSWSVPPGAPAPGNVPNFTANVAGNYTVVITNKTTGCSSAPAQGTVIVNANPDQPGVTETQPTCSVSTGTVTVTSPLDGGGIDYEYTKDNGANWQDGVNFTIPANTAYSIKARRKSTGCISVARTGTMGAAAGNPDAKVIVTENVDCSHLTGKVKIVQNVAGNTEFNTTDFEFSNNNSTWGSNPEFTFTAGGGYHLYVRRKADHSCVDDVECVAAAGKNNSNTETEATARSLGSATLESSITVKAMPNPFSNQVRFVINSTEQGDGTLDIFNMLGQKIKTVYQGNIPAGISYFDLKLPSQRGNLVYVLKIGDQKITGKLTQISSN
ncbi:MAG TPA: T9SS type A sorting domain-containing protein [Saprospiraceae bacterium]|nr:T9SS type A sorting domain-containing protein [Saprospiraceae bacterium]